MRRDGRGGVRRRRGPAFASALQSDCDASGLRRGGTGTCLAGPRSAAAAPGPRGVGRGGLGPGPHRRRCVHGGTGADRRVIGGCGFRAEPGLCLGQAGRGGAPSRRSFVGAVARADPPAYPFLALLVSGGHTQLVDVAALGRYRLLGETLDDAAGEAFDKTAKMLGLPYPGGAALAQLAETGVSGRFVFPRPMLDRPGLDFSFSGLKTAALVALRGRGLDDATRADVARGFQEAVIETLAEKSRRALLATGHRRLVVAGGVGANRRLRERLNEIAHQAGARAVFSARGVLHGQRCNDRIGGMFAFDGRGAPRPRFGCEGALGTRGVGSTGVLSISNG